MAFPPAVSSHLRRRRLALLGAAAAWLLPAADASLAAGYDSWSKVEQAQETRDYGLQIREGKFEAAQKAFIDETLLPQLGLEANRAAIASVRQRIRDVAVRGATKKEVVDQGNAAIRDGMLRIVADMNADPVVRVNAMLLIGELQESDRVPWPGSLAPLAKAAGDAALPLAVRIAAFDGLAAHVAAAGGSGPAATAAAPVVAALVAAPPEGDPIAARWLVSRALELLPSVPAQPAAVAAAARILADDKADTDLRVRAAVALGKLATPEAGIDAAAALGQIKSVAVAALKTDLDAAKERRFAKKMSGADAASGSREFGGAGLMPPPPAGRPEASGGGILGGAFGAGEALATVVDEDAVPTLACRRNAWRLFVLAGAVQPARAGPGLAGLLQAAAATAAADLATTMRQSAIDLDAKPDEESLAAALAAIEQLGAQAPAARRVQPEGQGDPGQPASPFDQPAGDSTSPF